MVFLIYLACLTIGVVFTLITAVIGHVFGHDHPGGDGHAGHDAGVSALSPTVIACFITAFGAFGIILTQFRITQPPYLSAPLSIVGGFMAAAAVLQMLRQLFNRTQSSSESCVASTVGQIATTITPIPENGVGEIAYVQAGTRYTAPAREEKGRPVSSGRSVHITRIIGTQYYVTAS